MGLVDDYTSQARQTVDADACNIVFTDISRMGQEDSVFEFESLYCFPPELGSEVKGISLNERFSSACALKENKHLSCWTDGLPQAFKP